MLVTYLKEGGSTHSLSGKTRMSQSSRRPDNHGQSVEDVSADQDCSTDGEKKSKQHGLQPPSELSPQDGPIRSSANPVESQSHRIADRRSSNSAVEVQVPSTGRANRKSMADSAGGGFPIDGSRSAETQSEAVSVEDTRLKSLAQAATDRASGQHQKDAQGQASQPSISFAHAPDYRLPVTQPTSQSQGASLNSQPVAAILGVTSATQPNQTTSSSGQDSTTISSSIGALQPQNVSLLNINQQQSAQGLLGSLVSQMLHQAAVQPLLSMPPAAQTQQQSTGDLPTALIQNAGTIPPLPSVSLQQLSGLLGSTLGTSVTGLDVGSQQVQQVLAMLQPQLSHITAQSSSTNNTNQQFLNVPLSSLDGVNLQVQPPGQAVVRAASSAQIPASHPTSVAAKPSDARSAGARHPAVILYQEGDKEALTAYQCLVRQYIEAFEVGKSMIRLAVRD